MVGELTAHMPRGTAQKKKKKKNLKNIMIRISKRK